jgi:hypothetical protein
MKPMQIINTRFSKATSEDDMMPVVKTAVVVLSKLHSEYKIYSSYQRQIFLTEVKIRQAKARITFLKSQLKHLGIKPSSPK